MSEPFERAPDYEPSVDLRAQRLHDIANKWQAFVAGNRWHDLHVVVPTLLAQLADPATPAERLVFRALALELMLQRFMPGYHEIVCRMLGSTSDPLVERRGEVSAADQRKRELAEAARHAIDRRYAERLTVRALSAMLHQNRNCLSRAFKEQVGVSIHGYVSLRRVLAAADLLVSKAWKVEAVAYNVGYRSKKDLYREFSRLLGMTPHAFRAASTTSRIKALRDIQPRPIGMRDPRKVIRRVDAS